MRHLIVIIVWIVISQFVHQAASAQDSKRVPALREQVYSQLARAQELADAGDVEAALAALKAVEGKLSSMNSYERAMLWNFYGYMHYGKDRIGKAITYFDKVVSEDPIPDALKQTTLFSLAQLSLGQNDYAQTLAYLDRWQQVTGEQQATKADVLRAQALYQKGDYEQALTPIKRAISAARATNETGEEAWYVLQRAIHYELGQTEAVADVLEQMIKHFNKPDYWTQLAGVYGQLGRDQQQLAMLEAAYQQGFLTRGQDLQMLVQSYFFGGVPFKAGQVMEQAIAQGKLEADLRNLKLLAQSWIAARETDKAVNALKQAAELSSDGELDAQRAQVLLNAERYPQAIAAAETALAKGNLEKPGTMHLVIGMAELEQENYNPALQAFAKAKAFADARKAAGQWERYATSEKEQAERIKELQSS
ncbi:tetratricopeptide repeat protein [Pseudidiomarina sp. 1APP75-27a]|uniref:tetratricopeptide repeat protein n=1 Tax=Pseudidiomarina terrestris TaxID=2820060 RepID=UPI002B056769|nr:tetratricopeptide repeat protein [Pseudidiomarina sp. 1APP75-27a]MEA3589004.1 tetratricopeptide repeat protein [Pseudidiomarina sp. 1APP75-27a]